MAGREVDRELREARTAIQVLQKELAETNIGMVALNLELEKAREALLASSQKVEALLDGVPALLWTTDTDLRVTSLAGAALPRIALRPETVHGRTLLDYFGRTENDYPPLAAHRRALAGEAASYEFEMRGSIFQAQVAPLHASSSQITGVIGVAQDVTERRRVERVVGRLTASGNALTGLDFFVDLVRGLAGAVGVSHALVGWLVGAEGSEAGEIATEALWVDGRLAENMRYALIGSPCEQVSRERKACIFERDVRALFPADTWLVAMGIDGYAGTPLFDPAGKVIGVLAILNRQPLPDVALVKAALRVASVRASAELVRLKGETERASIEAQFRQAQKMEAIGRLAGGIAHDFNNQIFVINGYADLLMARCRRDEVACKAAEQIRKAGGQAASLTSQLLTFSRKKVLEPKIVDLNDELRGVETTLKRLIGEDIELRTHLSPDTGSIKVDPTHLQQVIFNLAINARDAMPRGGTLTIATERLPASATSANALGPAGDRVRISVADTGHGMDVATIEHIFEPFFTTKGVEKGTGLGLATVHGIVEQSGGKITVTSRPGQGTTFQIDLPRVAGKASQAPEQEALTGEELDGNEISATVLFAEDEERVRRFVTDILVSHGFRVLSATNGSEALEMAERTAVPIDLLLTDVVMPGMNGAELAAQIEERRPGTRILYLSGYAADVLGGLGVLDEGIHLLHKPCTAGELLRKIRVVLRS